MARVFITVWSHTSGPHTVWLIWSILRVIELIKPARLWTKSTVRNSAASRCEIHTSTIQLTYILYSTPHLRATLLCIFYGFVGNVWRTHPIIHIPAFINCWRVQKQSEGEWDLFNESDSNKRYFLHTILSFGLIPSSLIHSVSFKRKDQQGSMCGYCWDCSDRQWFHGNSILT